VFDILMSNHPHFEGSALSRSYNFSQAFQLTLPIIAKRIAVKGLAAFLISILALISNAQQPTPLSKKEAAIKRKVDQLAPRAPISVVPINSQEEYGQFVSSNQEGFTFYDADRKAEVTLKYAEVCKIKNGYGGYNAAQQRHTDRTKTIVIVLAVVGALGG
jgi:hypothetical protein